MKVKKQIALILMIGWMVSFLGLHAAAGEQTLYVAPGGSDTASGTVDAPLKTLNGAREKAKNSSGRLTVYFRAGTYTLDRTVYFGENDRSDVTYKAFPGERVVFTAGTPYTGFEETTLNGIRAFKKNVGDADFNVLFSETRALSRPRYPENGYLKVRDISEADVEDLNAEKTFYAYRGMYVNKTDVPVFHNQTDVLIRILHYWKDEMLTIKSYSPTSGHMTFSRPTSMQVQKEDRFFFENVFEALNEPGEWYLDKNEGTLWYIPFEGEDASALTLWGSDVETMLQGNSVSRLTFENIIFRGNGFRIPRNNEKRDLSSQAAYDATPCLYFENAENITLKNCEFRDIAACAVYFGSGVKNAAVDSCVFDNIGAQAVFIRGQNLPLDDPQVTKDIRVVNNVVSGYGREFFNAVGILVIHANNVEVSHNEIRDGYYTAISCGWVWGYDYNVTSSNRICDNLIYNIGQGWLSDMGGIYMLGVQPGTLISGNVIHNVAADPGQGGYGGWGIYLDEGSSKMTVERNLVYACGSDSYHLHYGADNVIRNNIFALSADSQIRVVSRYEGHKTADFTNNIILTDGKSPAFSHMEDPAAFTARNNLLWDLTNGAALYALRSDEYEKAMSLETAERKGYLGENRIADPMFRDPLRFDFTLDAGSPALENGFVAWDYDDAGTVRGTVVGIDMPGGQTAYNAAASAVSPKSCRELFPLLNKLINRLFGILRRIAGVFGKIKTDI